MIIKRQGNLELIGVYLQLLEWRGQPLLVEQRGRCPCSTDAYRATVGGTTNILFCEDGEAELDDDENARSDMLLMFHFERALGRQEKVFGWARRVRHAHFDAGVLTLQFDDDMMYTIARIATQ